MAAFGTAAATGPYVNPNNDYNVAPTVSDGIQDLSWSPTSNVFVAGSWDNLVRCWEVQQSGTQFNAVPKAQISHDGPVLCTSFGGVCSASLALLSGFLTCLAGSGRQHGLLGVL